MDQLTCSGCRDLVPDQISEKSESKGAASEEDLPLLLIVLAFVFAGRRHIARLPDPADHSPEPQLKTCKIEVIRSPGWRNWQTQQTQNLPTLVVMGVRPPLPAPLKLFSISAGCSFRATQRYLVKPAPTKLAANGAEKKQAEETVVRAQLAWLELNGFAARALSP